MTLDQFMLVVRVFMGLLQKLQVKIAGLEEQVEACVPPTASVASTLWRFF